MTDRDSNLNNHAAAEYQSILVRRTAFTAHAFTQHRFLITFNYSIISHNELHVNFRRNNTDDSTRRRSHSIIYSQRASYIYIKDWKPMGPSRRQIRACFCRRLPRRDTTPVLIKTKLDASDQLDVWSKYKYKWMTEPRGTNVWSNYGLRVSETQA